MTTAREIFEAAFDVADGYQVGLRVSREPAAVGDVLDVSRVWVDGDRTDEELAGTCAIGLRSGSRMDSPVTMESVERALAIAAQYPGAHVMVIAGSDEGYGEDGCEVIIGEAEVMAVWVR